MRAPIFLALALGLSVWSQEVPLAPADPASLGPWAQAILPLRLHPTPASPVRFEGPSLSLRLFGEIALGQARYPFLLGVTPQGVVSLWLDKNRDGRLTPEEELPSVRAPKAVLWSVTLLAEPGDGASFSYPLQILWPEGRSYVFLVGGAPRAGEFQGRTVVLVDGDLDGVFGTKGDFLGVDVDGDGRIYAEPDGHERFSLAEAFTLEGTSYRVSQVAPDGGFIRVDPTAYVPPKVPLIPGAPAPDFSFRNFLDGRVLSLSQFRGKVVLLDFWATWCPPCMASLPELRTLYEELRPLGFEIVGVSLDESGEDLRRVVESYAVPWPIAFFGQRWDNPVANLYRVYQIPTTYLLDRRGIIRFRDLHGEELRAAVRDLLGEPSGAGEDGQAAAAPVLAFFFPQEIRLRSGVTRFALEILNDSLFPAEEVAISWEGLPAGVKDEVPPPFPVGAGERRRVELTLAADRSVAFSQDVFVVVSYGYRSGDSLSRATQRLPVRLVLAEERPKEEAPWWVWGLLVLGLALAVWVLGRGSLFLWPLLFLVLPRLPGFWKV